MNRRLVDALCDFHYAPTPKARENLIRENIPEDRIIVTGNTAIDALLDAAAQPYKFADPLLDHAGRERRLLLVTAHRRESFGEPFMQICTAIRELAETNRDVEIIYSVHPNPNVRKAVNEVLLERERVFLVEPLDYITFVHLLKKATIVLTDSGGIQEEAPSLGKPVLVMREVTERPEGVEAGTAMLVGTARKRIVDGVQRLLDDQKFYEGMAHAVNPYGDGLASKRIGDHLEGMAKRLFWETIDHFKPGEVYNIGGDRFHSIEELSDVVLQVTGADPGLVQYRNSEILTTLIKKVDISKAVRDLDHKITYSWEDGMRLTAEWMRDVYRHSIK